MLVKIRLYGTLRRLSGPQTPGLWEGDIPAGSRIVDVLERLGAGKYEANAAAINGEPCPLDAIIPEGAEVTIVTPMGGGSF